MKKTTGEDRIAAIRLRLAASTPGRWHWVDDANIPEEHHAGSVATTDSEGDVWYIAKIERDAPNPEADGWFLANAHADIEWLLSVVDTKNARR